MCRKTSEDINLFLRNNKTKKRKKSNEKLCALYKKGNRLALDELIQKNENLIYSRVKKFTKTFNHDLTDEELFQEGCIGLIKAIERFDN